MTSSLARVRVHLITGYVRGGSASAGLRHVDPRSSLVAGTSDGAQDVRLTCVLRASGWGASTGNGPPLLPSPHQAHRNPCCASRRGLEEDQGCGGLSRDAYSVPRASLHRRPGLGGRRLAWRISRRISRGSTSANTPIAARAGRFAPAAALRDMRSRVTPLANSTQASRPSAHVGNG